MAKRKTNAISLLGKRKKRDNPSPVGGMIENAAETALAPIVSEVIPAGAGFIGATLIGKVVAGLVARRFPVLARWVTPAIGFGLFAGVLVLGSRWRLMSKWATPIAVGAGLAGLLGLVSAFAPWVGQFLSPVVPVGPVTSPNYGGETAVTLDPNDPSAAQLTEGGQATTEVEESLYAGSFARR